MIRLRHWFSAACLVGGAALAAAASAETYPDHPLRIVLGFAPGGPVDGSARIAAKILSDGLGQSVSVENRTGAGGAIAAAAVAHAAPDGYTLLVNATSDVINPIVNPAVGYSIAKDFVPIGLIASAPNVLVVHPSLPVHSVKELVAYAKSHEVSYGSAGVNTVSHLAGALLSASDGTPMTHVPYRGTGAAQVDLLAGRIPVMFDGLVTGLANAKTGKVRAIAVTSPERWPGAPDLPTVAEAGYPGYALLAIFGLMAPAGTPAPVIARLATTLEAGLKTPAVIAQLAALGVEPGRMGPTDYRAYLDRETGRWTRLAAAGQLKKED